MSADLAVIFRFGPNEIDELNIEDFCAWHKQAAKRMEQFNALRGIGG